MLRFYLCKGFNNLLEQDDKGDVSTETTGPASAEVSAGIQISDDKGDASAGRQRVLPGQIILAGLQNSAERRAVLLAYP
ncbi:hypothetical protein V6N13_125175 [Hibiscus sabdariffa]|uniref:Uncharacterized protein n=1 Tax=Hibiscus sabdariffa TaxID=183260 RepID=A0ABR2U4X3_9ROSI